MNQGSELLPKLLMKELSLLTLLVRFIILIVQLSIFLAIAWRRLWGNRLLLLCLSGTGICTVSVSIVLLKQGNPGFLEKQLSLLLSGRVEKSFRLSFQSLIGKQKKECILQG